MDGPGLDNVDVPDGTVQPKLQFTISVPTAEFFRLMRVNQASLDLVQQFGVSLSIRGWRYRPSAGCGAGGVE
jgi:hypothetical protein